MSSAGAVRAGGAFVEIFANDSKFQQAMTRISNKLRAVGQTMQRIGTGMSISGAALAAPLVMAGRQAAGFEDAILAMQGAAGLSADEVARLSDAAKSMASDMGISPTKLAQAFLELAKAGMTVDEVLKGAGKSAVEFAKVGAVDSEQAAVFMKVAMNTFGISAEEAVDTLVAAANSSETSISNMVESFSQVGSAGSAFSQSLFGVSQAMAVLAKSGIVGEEAGTAIKTMLTKLVAPTQDAQEALAVLGLKMSDFRDQAGKLLPMAQIAGVFERALGSMDSNAIDLMMSQQALVDVFEQRGIKVITAFANVGEKGFQKVAEEMSSALPVSQQFEIMMSGISGQVSRLAGGVELMSIAFGNAIGGALKNATDLLTDMMGKVAKLVTDFPVLGQVAAAAAFGLIAIGTAAIAVGIALKGMAMAQAAVLALMGPKGWAILGIASLIGLGGYLAASYSDAKKEIKDAAKEVEDLNRKAEGGADGANNTTPDVNRPPLADDAAFQAAEQRRLGAEELAKEDLAFEEAQVKAIGSIQELSNSLVGEVDEVIRTLGEELEGGIGNLGDSAFNAAVNAQAELRKIGEMLAAGVLNPEGAKVLADRIKAQFEADMEAIKKSNEIKARDFGPSVGGFSNSAGVGVGPQLRAAIAEAVDIPLNQAAMAGRRNAAMGGVAAAAKAGASGGGLDSSMERLLSQVAQQTKAVAEQTPILKRIADGVSGGGLVFA